jgi:predicted cupin superfamily sugar epimerase
MSSSSFLPEKVADLVHALGLIPHPEGGFFLETHRSGSEPMSSKGQSDLQVADRCLVTTNDRNERRGDKDPRRNALTSIYWVPTKNSPTLPLTANLSDHVHYYQGGKPFQYTVYNPATGKIAKYILGPKILAGHVLQVPVNGGEWKCGRLVDDADFVQDYGIVAEAVGPGFDFHDFQWVSSGELDGLPADIQAQLRPFLHGEIKMDSAEDHFYDGKHENFEGHYDGGDVKEKRASHRI